MNKRKLILIVFSFILVISAGIFVKLINSGNNPFKKTGSSQKVLAENSSPLSIEAMRQATYPGSDLTIEQTLSPGENYSRYIASYQSDQLKIYGLLTIPTGERPKNGWPIIIFIHGYIPPEQYQTTERYVAYVDGFAKNGYIVFKPDLRGNGNSQGTPEGAYYSPAYATDVLNAITSVKKYKDVNPDKIGIWGHSMGGNIALRVLVVSKDIKAVVIWGGVVGSYSDLMNNWQRTVPYRPSQRELALRNNNRADLIQKYGTPDSNPAFWNSIDPTYNLSYVTAPIQLHHGLADEEVPVAFSEVLKNKLEAAGKYVEYYTYPGADHNISGPSFTQAMQRSVEFFNKYLKES